MIRGSLLAAFVFVVCGAVGLDATAVIVFRDASRIILAGDSRATVLDEGSDEYRSVDNDCKIHRSGRWFFLTSGYESGAGVNVRATVTRVIATADTMPAALAAVQRAYTETIRTGLTSPLARSFFARKFRGQAVPVLNVLVAGVDRGVLTVGYFGVDMTRPDPFEVAPGWGLCPGALCPDGRLLYGSSQPGPMLALLTRRPRPDWVEAASARGARKLIELQIASTPERVGPPIDVLEITAAGARWVDRDPRSACAAIR